MTFSFASASAAPRRRPSLTPMIDVVFLLLVFFLLAARFGSEAQIALRTAAGGTAEWTGPPRLVDVAPDALGLNGRPVDADTLVASLSRMIETESDPILIRPDTQASTQRLIDVLALLTEGGFTGLVLVAP